MNKKKIGVILVLSILIISVFIITKNRYSTSEYVIKHQRTMTTIASALLDEHDEKIYHYDGIIDFITNSNIRAIWKNLKIKDIYVEKYNNYYGDEYSNRVTIYLKDKPKNKDCFNCGIYYSPDNCVLDYNGEYISDEENEYFVDGRAEKKRIIYSTEKICDNWFYFEEAVW